jgi:hypothetical protein
MSCHTPLLLDPVFRCHTNFLSGYIVPQLGRSRSLSVSEPFGGGDMHFLSGNLIFTPDYVSYSVLALRPCGSSKCHPASSGCMDDKFKNHRMEFDDILYLRIHEELLSFYFAQA